MLRAAIKHGISKALSSSAGFEVWDFEIREEQPSQDKVTIEIRYRYHPGLCFFAAITARSVDGNVPTYEISAEAVPGEVGEKEMLVLAGRQELCTAIERWTMRIEEELSARPSNRVMAAQQKAIAYLEKHLLDIPDQHLTREQITEYRRRLERLEAAVIEIRAPKKDHSNGTRAEAVRQEFASLRSRLEVLGERSFLHAVLVRLVKYFWDDENLRIIEAGSRAAQDFLKDQDHPLSVVAKPEASVARNAPKTEVPVVSRTSAKAEAPPAGRAVAKAEAPAPARTAAKPESAPAAGRATAAPEAALGGRARVKPEPRITAKPEARTQPKPEAPTEAGPGAAPPQAERLRAAYKPLRPGRG